MTRTLLQVSLVLTAALLMPAVMCRADNSIQREFVIGDNKLVPQALDVDPDGNVYVAGGEEIWVYDAAGNRTAVWQFSAGRPIRVAPDGRIVAGRTWEPDIRLRVFDRAGTEMGQIGVGKFLHGDGVGHDVPYGIAFDPDGSIWTTNTHANDETEARKDIPNTAWGGLRTDPNGGRIMFFDLKKDPQGRNPRYFGTFSNTPPEKGGPPDALHLPKRLTFDAVHKKLFVMDAWGVTRWDWPSGAFEKRIIRSDVYRGDGLIASTPKGTLYIRLSNTLQEYDMDGNKLADLPGIDVNNATDLVVSRAGNLYLPYPDRKISFKEFSPDGKLILARGLNVVNMQLSLSDKVFTAGQTVPVVAKVTDRRDLYGIVMPGAEELSRSIWIRPYVLRSQWQAVPIQAGGGQDTVTFPPGITGAATVRLSTSAISPDLLDDSAAAIEIGVGLVPPGNTKGSIGLTADRNQGAFVTGQWIRLNLVGRSVAGAPNETVDIYLYNDTPPLLASDRVPVVARGLSWSIPANGAATIPLDLRLPEPGDYEVFAQSRSLGQCSFALHAAPSIERGRFKLFAALNMGYRLDSDVTRAYIQVAARDGVTHDISRYIGASYEIGNLGNELGINEQMRSILAGDARLPAPETAEQPSRLRVGLQQMEQAGMHLWPETMGWELDTVNRTEKQSIQDKQNLSNWTLWGIESPSQDGYLWNESNWWGVDHKRLMDEWSKTTGRPVDALDGLDWGRLREYSPLLSGRKLQDALSYQEYMAKNLYPHYYAQWKDYVETMRPGITGAGVPAFYPINWPVQASQPLDGVMSYHQVEQMAEPYMQLNDCAFMVHDGKPFWAGVESYPDPGTGEYMARQLLPALLYGAEGFWVNDMGGFLGSMTIDAHDTVRRAYRHQAAANLRSVLEPVGTRLRSAHRTADLGIYFPRAAWVQQGNPAFKGDSYVKRVSAAIIASAVAHIPARVVFDDQLEQSDAGVKVLLLPGLQTDITDADMASLHRFHKAGGIILSGAETADAYKPLGKSIDVDFSIFQNDDYSDWFTQDSRVEKRLRVIALAKTLGHALAPYVHPPIGIDDPDVWVSLFDARDNRDRPLTYLVAVNQKFPDALQTYQLWKMTSSFDSILPIMRTARVPARFKYAYDLLGGSPIAVTNGQVTLDFRRFAARVIALSTVPLTASDLVEGGQAKTGAAASGKTRTVAYLTAAPAVDLFYGEKIHKALQSHQPIYLVGGRPNQKQVVTDALKAKGLDVQPAAPDVSAEEGVHLVIAQPGDDYWKDQHDILPVRLTQDVPGPGRAMLMYIPAYLPGARDAILISPGDDDGLNKAAARLAELAVQTTAIPETRLVAPHIQPAPPAPLTKDTASLWGARLTTVQASGNTVAVGAAEWGNNLFLLDPADGHLLSASKAGRWYVDTLRISQDGGSIGAEAIYPEDVNGYLEVFDRAGKSQARYARDGVNSHSNWDYADTCTRSDIFSFAISPDGNTIYSASNEGIEALGRDGKLIWRHDLRHDLAGMQMGLQTLRNKWAARLSLSQDGKLLAAGLTHELNGSETYRGVSRVQLLDAATGNVVWDFSLDPIENPQITQIEISPDGGTVAFLDNYYGLVLLQNGHIVKQRHGQFNRIAWSRDSTRLYALLTKDAHDGVLALDATGDPLWEYEQDTPIVSLAPIGKGVAISDSARTVTMISPTGSLVWTATMDGAGSVSASADALYGCDWMGNVYRFNPDRGAVLWKTNVTKNTWRDDIEALPTTPYAGPTFGAPKRRAEEQPLTGPNLALQATVKAGGTQGWFSTAKILIDPVTLTDGKLNDEPTPWMSLSDQYKAGNWSRYVWVEMSWPQPVTLKGISVHEDERHPESWPYDACVQTWDGDAWTDVASDTMMPGPWHNITFQAPLITQRIRYCVTDTLENNVWTDEIMAVGK